MKNILLKKCISCLIATCILLMAVVNTVSISVEAQETTESIKNGNVIETAKYDVKSRNTIVNGNINKTEYLSDLHDGIISYLNNSTEITADYDINVKTYSKGGSVYSNRNYSINAGQVSLMAVIVAESNIDINTSNISSNDFSLLYSKSGNINLNAKETNFKGIIYAPNGTVTISGSNIDITGTIIAKEIIVRAKEFKLNADIGINDVIERLKNIKTAKISALTLSIDEKPYLCWTENDDIVKSEIYVRHNDDDFEKISDVTNFEYCYEDSLDTGFIDFRVVSYTKYGDIIYSFIKTLQKDNEILEVVTRDSDDDKIPDGYEKWDMKTDPYTCDTDKDGINDGYEVLLLISDPNINDSTNDYDQDGLTNLIEYQKGTNPIIADSDFDGIIDINDTQPLLTDTNSDVLPDYEFKLEPGLFDIVIGYYDENNIYNYSIYNYITAQTIVNNIDETAVIKLTNDLEHTNSLLERKGNTYSVNTYTYQGDNVSTVTNNGQRYEFNYDDNNNMISFNIGNSNMITNSYDQNVLSGLTYGNGNNIEYVYDDQGKVNNILQDDQTAYTYQYDDKGNVVLISDINNDLISTFDYDEEGNISKISSSNNMQIEYNLSENNFSIAYDNGDEKREQSFYAVSSENGTSITNYVSDLISGASITEGQDAESEYTNTLNLASDKKIETKVLYDNKNINSIIYDNGSSLNYKYDSNGNIVSVSDDNNVMLEYRYDEKGQLIREDNAYAGISYVYTYDIRGNVISSSEYSCSYGDLSHIIKKNVYQYNNGEWSDLLSSYNDEIITYDEIGNPLSYLNGITLEWTNGRQLKGLHKNGKYAEYSYDSFGNRLNKKVDGIETEYFTDGDVLVGEFSKGSDIWYIYDGHNEIIGFELNGISYYYEKNLLGDIVKILDQDGNFVCRYTYDAWGNIIDIEGNKVIAETNPFRYRGYYYDEESGFYYLKTRYYDPQIHRFINADSIFACYNLYMYCENNPVNLVDYEGMDPLACVDRYGRIYVSTWGYSGIGYEEYTNSNRFYELSTNKTIEFNCYLWALGYYRYDISGGGVGSFCGEHLSSYALDTVKSLVIKDVREGLKRGICEVPTPTYPTTGRYYIIALRVRETNDTDYHFMRRIGNTWTFKGGWVGRVFELGSGYTPDDVLWNQYNLSNGVWTVASENHYVSNTVYFRVK